MIAVKFLKGWKGEVAVAPDATLGQLLAALHTASSIEPAACASLIAKGKKIDLGTASRDARIDALGIVHNTPVMLVCHDAAVLTMLQTERRMKRLADVEAAARLISDRDGAGLLELSLTNQDGSAVSMPEADRKALSLGMMLHAKVLVVLPHPTSNLTEPEPENGPGPGPGPEPKPEPDPNRGASCLKPRRRAWSASRIPSASQRWRRRRRRASRHSAPRRARCRRRCSTSRRRSARWTWPTRSGSSSPTT